MTETPDTGPIIRFAQERVKIPSQAGIDYGKSWFFSRLQPGKDTP